MTDPISGKIASQAIQQMDPGQGVGGPKGTSGTGRGPSFQEVMNRQQAEAANEAQAAEGAGAPQEVDRVGQVDKPEQARLDQFVDGILKDEKLLDAMMARCMGGEAMSQQELLQMQGLIYAYSQKVELASKLVEKATGGVKQIMNTQV